MCRAAYRCERCGSKRDLSSCIISASSTAPPSHAEYGAPIATTSIMLYDVRVA